MDENDIVKPIVEKMFGAIFYPTPERAIRAISALYKYGKFLVKKEISLKTYLLDISKNPKLISYYFSSFPFW